MQYPWGGNHQRHPANGYIPMFRNEQNFYRYGYGNNGNLRVASEQLCRLMQPQQNQGGGNTGGLIENIDRHIMSDSSSNPLYKKEMFDLGFSNILNQEAKLEAEMALVKRAKQNHKDAVPYLEELCNRKRELENRSYSHFPLTIGEVDMIFEIVGDLSREDCHVTLRTILGFRHWNDVQNNVRKSDDPTKHINREVMIHFMSKLATIPTSPIIPRDYGVATPRNFFGNMIPPSSLFAGRRTFIEMNEHYKRKGLFVNGESWMNNKVYYQTILPFEQPSNEYDEIRYETNRVLLGLYLQVPGFDEYVEEKLTGIGSIGGPATTGVADGRKYKFRVPLAELNGFLETCWVEQPRKLCFGKIFF